MLEPDHVRAVPVIGHLRTLRCFRDEETGIVTIEATPPEVSAGGINIGSSLLIDRDATGHIIAAELLVHEDLWETAPVSIPPNTVDGDLVVDVTQREVMVDTNIRVIRDPSGKVVQVVIQEECTPDEVVSLGAGVAAGLCGTRLASLFLQIPLKP